jgi:predicted TIM-barrel fold metal-dependent hydrolase
MNERIKQLAEQAKLNPALLLQHWGTIDALTDSEQESLERIEKFAELIVKECGEVAYKAFWDNPETVRGIHIKEKIKQQFGVE